MFRATKRWRCIDIRSYYMVSRQQNHLGYMVWCAKKYRFVNNYSRHQPLENVVLLFFIFDYANVKIQFTKQPSSIKLNPFCYVFQESLPERKCHRLYGSFTVAITCIFQSEPRHMQFRNRAINPYSHPVPISSDSLVKIDIDTPRGSYYRIRH